MKDCFCHQRILSIFYPFRKVPCEFSIVLTIVGVDWDEYPLER